MNLPSLPTFPSTPSYPLVPFPAGANDTDTLIPPDIHLNLTALGNWDYHLYANATISNETHCFLAVAPLILHPNGTWLNYTSCFDGLQELGPRGRVSIGFAVMLALALLFCLSCLNKLGTVYLRPEKRFSPVGRRWQWYWAIFVCATGMISLFMNLDVDRVYVVSLHIIITSFFWFLMQLGTIAMVWEAVRHWGSWQERQIMDPDPFALRDNDRRSKVEFWLPLWFYFCLWLNFFMIIPRNWEPIQLQRSDDQTETRALPAATDARFKAGAFTLVSCWATIVFSLIYSIKHYKLRPRRRALTGVAWIRHTPLRFAIEIPLTLLLIAYQALVSFDFDKSILKVHGNLYAIFAGGYGPTIVIILTQIVYGMTTVNEDRLLIKQRIALGVEMDRDLGLTSKPNWWRQLRPAASGDSMIEQLTRNVGEVSGSRPARSEPKRAPAGTSPQLDRPPDGASAQPTLGLKSSSTTLNDDGTIASSAGGSPPPYTERIDRVGTTPSQASSLETAEAHSAKAKSRLKIRSMLDV